MAERVREQVTPGASALRYLGDEQMPPVRDAEAARAIAHEHAWLIERALGRLAARWPEQIDPCQLREGANEVLGELALVVERPDELAETAAEQIAQRIAGLLSGSEWYREAMMGRARPLCDAWAGALIAGREPTDHLLVSWLRLDETGLREHFLETAVVFAVEPAALLRPCADLQPQLQAPPGNLPSDQQLAAALYFCEQLTYEEIGTVLSVTAEHAQGLLGRYAMTLVGETVIATWPGRLSA